MAPTATDEKAETKAEETPAAADATPKAKTLGHITIKEDPEWTSYAIVVQVRADVTNEAVLKAVSDLASPVVRLAEKNEVFARRDDRKVYTVVKVTGTELPAKVKRAASGPKRLDTDKLLNRMRELKAEHGRIKAFEMACAEQNLSEERIAFLKEEFGIGEAAA